MNPLFPCFSHAESSENRHRHKPVFQNLMDKKEEVYFSAKEAVNHGFADYIFGDDGVYDWTELKHFPEE